MVRHFTRGMAPVSMSCRAKTPAEAWGSHSGEVRPHPCEEQLRPRTIGQVIRCAVRDCCAFLPPADTYHLQRNAITEARCDSAQRNVQPFYFVGCIHHVQQQRAHAPWCQTAGFGSGVRRR